MFPNEFPHQYILLKPEFIGGDFSLALSPTIDKDLAERHMFPPILEVFPNIIKVDNQYRLAFYEVGWGEIFDAGILETFAPFLADAHFIIYYENFVNCTFETDFLTEVKIEKGKFTWQKIPHRIAMPYTRFFNELPQDFNFPLFFRFANKEIWQQQEKVRQDIIDSCISKIDFYLGDTHNTSPYSPIGFGLAFRENDHLQMLLEVDPEYPQIPSLTQKLTTVQENDRKILLEMLANKVGESNNKTTLSQFDKVEKTLNITFPITLKAIYTQISNGKFGPDYGLLPLDTYRNSIYKLTLLLRKQKFENNLVFPTYVIPFLYLGKGCYSCLDCSKASFAVVNYNRNIAKKSTNLLDFYAAFEEIDESLEGWLDDWLYFSKQNN